MSESQAPTAVRTLYASDATARAMLDHFASRQQDRSEITVDRIWELLATEGHVVGRAEVISAFRKLEEIGAGKFVIGRKGHSSRFLRAVSLIDLGRMARGADPEEAREPAPALRQPAPAARAEREVIAHRYVLRPDFTVTVQLPADLTQAEALRLSEYVKTLPFSG